jgi:hypothetical protein
MGVCMIAMQHDYALVFWVTPLKEMHVSTIDIGFSALVFYV